MATSGTSAFAPPLTYIVKQAWINLNLITEDEEPSAAMYAEGAFKINAMTKALEMTGLHVWTEEEAILFLQPLQAKYVIGQGGTANCADADAWLELTLAAPNAVGNTTITLQDASLVVDGFNLGVVLNSGVTFWTTAVGASTGQVVTLAAPMPGTTNAGNYVLAYAPAAAIGKPLKVPRARLLTLNGLNETPMTVLSRQEYEDLPQKVGAPGTPTQFFYSPRRDNGFMYIWPVPRFSNWAQRLTWYRPLQDWLLPTNTADFPAEWINPLVWGLTKELAPGKAVPEPTWQRVKEMSDIYSLMAISYDRESEPVQFGMDYWQYGG